MKSLLEIQAEVAKLLPKCDDADAFRRTWETLSQYVFDVQNKSYSDGFRQGYYDPDFNDDKDED